MFVLINGTEAKICDLDRAGGVQQNILRLKIPVTDALLV